MRTLGFVLSAVLTVVALQFAAAQPFSGTFVSAEAGLTLTLQQDGGGALSGSLTGPNGQFPVQGEASGTNAYGVAESQQGPLGFQAQVSPDGGMLQIMFFQVGNDGQPTPAGPPITMQRQGAGGAGGTGMPGAPGAPGSGGMPGGGMPGGGTPGGGMPGGGMPGGSMPGGGMPGGGAPGGFPPQPPVGGQPPAGGFPPPAQTGIPDWNGTFVGNNGTTALVVQGAQNSYTGYIQDQGQQYQFEAHIDDATLHGAFMVNGAQYEFWADRNGPSVMLYLGNTTYVLQQR